MFKELSNKVAHGVVVSGRAVGNGIKKIPALFLIMAVIVFTIAVVISLFPNKRNEEYQKTIFSTNKNSQKNNPIKTPVNTADEILQNILNRIYSINPKIDKTPISRVKNVFEEGLLTEKAYKNFRLPLNQNFGLQWNNLKNSEKPSQIIVSLKKNLEPTPKSTNTKQYFSYIVDQNYSYETEEFYQRLIVNCEMVLENNQWKLDKLIEVYKKTLGDLN